MHHHVVKPRTEVGRVVGLLYGMRIGASRIAARR
jgi:hypothetical protein